MSEIKYNFEPTKDKPSRKYRKGSKYDPVIEAFKKSPHSLVKVEISGVEANYIRTQIKKRLDATSDKSITVSVVNNTCYLEKGKTAEKPKKSHKGKAPEEEKPPEEMATDNQQPPA